MSFGFEVFNADGSLAVNDKDFTVIAERVFVPAGEHTYARDNGLVGVAAKGSDLTNLCVVYSPSRIRVFTGGGYLLFYRSSQYVSSEVGFGVVVNDSDGRTTFSSSNIHFAVETVTPLRINQYGYSVSASSDKAYMLGHAGRILTLAMQQGRTMYVVNYSQLVKENNRVYVRYRPLGLTGWPGDWNLGNPSMAGSLITLNGV